MILYYPVYISYQLKSFSRKFHSEKSSSDKLWKFWDRIFKQLLDQFKKFFCIKNDSKEEEDSPVMQFELQKRISDEVYAYIDTNAENMRYCSREPQPNLHDEIHKKIIARFFSYSLNPESYVCSQEPELDAVLGTSTVNQRSAEKKRDTAIFNYEVLSSFATSPVSSSAVLVPVIVKRQSSPRSSAEFPMMKIT
ncbi:uncharacterized protein LOC118188924 [Stegodyphus dumicola]|uniref:uncharacterized protein LOC118188924 n=1 Tax=Stegodyphus dumicola TaxID=202533 RepID=UPI0015B3326D|nr:uncharacterized protein LOC118188924 [Stegodyphus dumicola]